MWCCVHGSLNVSVVLCVCQFEHECDGVCMFGLFVLFWVVFGFWVFFWEVGGGEGGGGRVYM